MTRWRTAKLEDIAQVVGGGTPSRREPNYFGGAIAWATPTDVTSLDRLHISGTKESITEEGLANSSTKMLPAGSVLLTSRATIGYTAVSSIPICTNQGFVNFVCGPDVIPEFLAYWLRSQKDKLIQYAGGTTFKEIARGTLKKFEITLPPIEEQRSIVDTLSRAEGIVRLRREAEAKAKEIIPALFIDMFGDPEQNAKNWPICKVKDFVARFEGGKNLMAGSDMPGGFRILKVSAVTSGRYLESESKPAPNNYVPPANHLIRPGDLLFSRANTEALVGATAIVDATKGNTLLPDKLWRFVWSETVDASYMHALFQCPSIRRELSRLSSGTSASMRNISQAKLFDLTLPVAPYGRQKEFGEKVSLIRSVSDQQGTALVKAQAALASLLNYAFVAGPIASTTP